MLTLRAANKGKIAAACASASGGSVLKWSALCRSSWVATKLAPTHASTTLPFVFVLSTSSLNILNTGTLSYSCSHHRFALSSEAVPRNQSMRASSVQLPVLQGEAAKTKDRSGLRDSHTMRQPLRMKNDHNAWLRA